MIFTDSGEVELSVYLPLAGPSSYSSGNTLTRSILGTAVLDALVSKLYAVLCVELYSVLIFFPFELPEDFAVKGCRPSLATAL